MLVHEVAVLPTAETLEYLQRVLTASSLPFKPDEWYLTLNVSDQEGMVPNPDGFYTATPVNLDIWYDPASESAQLILLFQSESLTERALQLREEAPNPFHQSYYPNVKLLPYMPPLRRHFVAQVNSYGDTFLRDEFPFTFASEFLYSYDAVRAPDIGLYQDLDIKYAQTLNRRTGV